MVQKAAALAVLQNTTLFEGLSTETLEAIADAATRRTFEEGDSVYDLGDDAGEVYIVETGRIRFSLGAGNRAGASGSIVMPGQVFGWAAVVEEHPRRVATASCLEVSTVLAISGQQLLAVFAKDTSAGYIVMRRLAGLIAGNFMEALAT